MIRRHFLAATLCALLAACMTMANDTSFGPDSPTALIIVADTSGGPTNHIFRQVDWENNRFLEGHILITTGRSGSGYGMSEAGSAYALVPQEAPPGDYVQIDMQTNGFNGYAQTMGQVCFNAGTPVISLRPGQITIYEAPRLRRNPAFHEQRGALRAQIERARANFPAIRGETVFAEYDRVIAYDDLYGVTIGHSECDSRGETFRRVQP